MKNPLVYYFSTYWNTIGFLSELIAGFFVVFLLLLPMYFIPLIKMKNKRTEEILTLVFQSMGVTFGIIFGKTIGDLMLGANGVKPIGIGNSSSDLLIAFRTMEFKGILYMLLGNLGGGVLAAFVAFFIFKFYNNVTNNKQDLSLIFSNPVKKWKVLFFNETFFAFIWLMGLVAIIGMESEDKFQFRNTMVSIYALVLLVASSTFGFFVLAINFNIARWMVGVVILRNTTKLATAQLSAMITINCGVSILVGCLYFLVNRF